MKIIPFEAIDASNFNADLGTVSAARLLTINFETNAYRWQACDPESGEPLSAAVFGTSSPEGEDATEDAASGHIRADIQRTLS